MFFRKPLYGGYFSIRDSFLRIPLFEVFAVVMMRFAHITGKTMGGIDCCFTKIGIASTPS